MGLLLALAVLFIIFVLPFYVLGQVSQLRREVEELRAIVKGQSAPQRSVEVARPSIYGDAYDQARAELAAQPVVEPLPSAPAPQPLIPRPAPLTQSAPVADTPNWFTEDVFMKIGAVLILIAVGWFVSYAFMNNWIGPMGRILLGVSAGLLLMLIGVWRSLTMVTQGAVFIALGMSTAMLSIYAARYAYDFFTPGFALISMFLIVAVTAALSIRFKVQSLAVTALIAGAFAPVLAVTANPDVLGLHTYLGVLFAGTLFVAAVMPAPALIVVALVIATLYGSPYLFLSSPDMEVARAAAFVFSAVFILFSTVALMRTAVQNYKLYLTTCIGAALYIVMWIIAAVPADMQGLIAALWGAGFLTAASVLWQTLEKREPAYVQLGIAVSFFALATAFYLDGIALLMTYLVQITALICVALWYLKDVTIARSLAVLYTGVVLLSIPSFVAPAWEYAILHADMLALLSIGVTFLFVGWQIHEANDDSYTDATLMTIGGIYLLLLIWLMNETLLGAQLGTAVSLVMYTVIGLTLYMSGLSAGYQYIRIVGACIIGGVIARLLLVDIWELELVFRIIAFFVIGVMLLSTAFVSKKALTNET